jgi:hypothetical protein
LGIAMQKISQAFGGRYDRHQLRDRWHGQAAQRNSRKLGRWTQDEDKRLKAVRMWPVPEQSMELLLYVCELGMLCRSWAGWLT